MTLRPYQADAVQFLHARKRALLALPPGAGKTAIVATALGGLPQSYRFLVIAPNGPVLDHWQRELWEWAAVPAFIGVGSKKLRAHWRDVVLDGGALILNYECFRNDIEELLTIPWDAVVFDESHRLKGRQTHTFAAAKRLKTEYLFLVSGTPILNRADELWTSLHLMDPKKYRGFWKWAEARFDINFNRHRGRLVREVGDIKSAEHLLHVRKELHERMYFRPLDEILPELPPVTVTYHEVELSAEERTAHDTMLEKAWMELGGDLVQAPNAITKMTRLRQLCSDWSVFGEPAGTKAHAVAQLVGDEPCVVFCAFRATADAVAGLLPNAMPYHGGHSDMDRNSRINLFKAGKIDTLVATIATMGEGIDGLQHVAHTAIFLDRDWTPARNDQAVARLRRVGQQDSVNVIHVVALDTVDDVVNSALRTKREVVSAIIENQPKRSKDAVH